MSKNLLGSHDFTFSLPCNGTRCTIKIFRGGRGGGWGGGSSERCLKWGGRGWGSLRDLSKNILKELVGKGKSCS